MLKPYFYLSISNKIIFTHIKTNEMKRQIPLFFLLILILSFLFTTSCVENKNENDNSMFDSLVNQQKSTDIPIEVINKVLKSLPSPVEMTTMIKQTGAEFQEKNINDDDNYKNYTSSYKRALNLGIYGTDLGYINMYDKYLLSGAYLDIVRKLADDLNVGQFFDLGTIKRMVSNKNNVDSLMYISTVSFEKMTTHLKEKNRSHIGALILVGGWLEGLYILTQTYETNPSKDFAEKICEQKIAVNDLMLLLSVYEKESSFNQLNNDFKKIKSTFDAVEITYTVGEPTAEVIDGVLVVQDQTKSVIKYTDEQLKNIINETSRLRNDIIK